MYLDNNATTQPLPAVAEAVASALGEFWQNPSSVHRAGQAVRQQVELARKACGELVGVKPRQVTFTSSGTEAIDLAIRGTLLAKGRVGAKRGGGGGGGGPGVVVTSRLEHSAVVKLCEALEKHEGVVTRWVKIESGGVVSVEDIERLVRDEARVDVVSVQWANNETGVVQPVGEIARLCRSRGVVFHCDATQWVGKMPVENAGEFDLLTFSAHKFHGPKGVGVLVAAPGVGVSPLLSGEQEMGRRGGTENVPGIIGAGVAARLAREWLIDRRGREAIAALRDRFERGVLERVAQARVNGRVDQPDEAVGTRRLWNTTNIGFESLEAEALLLLLSERRVCASAGAACSSGSLDPSPVLLAMGITPAVAHGSLRFSLSRLSTEREIDEGVDVVAACVRRLTGSMGSMRPGG